MRMVWQVLQGMSGAGMPDKQTVTERMIAEHLVYIV